MRVLHGNTRCKTCGTRKGRRNTWGVKINPYTKLPECRRCYDKYAPPLVEGVVASFDEARGCGRITTGHKSVFVHYSAIEAERRVLVKGEAVKCNVLSGPSGMYASRVLVGGASDPVGGVRCSRNR